MIRIGRLVATPDALGALDDEGENAITFVMRHQKGDWGDLDAADKKANDEAAMFQRRIVSAYILPRTNIKIWIITEWDRSCTTVLLPENY